MRTDVDVFCHPHHHFHKLSYWDSPRTDQNPPKNHIIQRLEKYSKEPPPFVLKPSAQYFQVAKKFVRWRNQIQIFEANQSDIWG